MNCQYSGEEFIPMRSNQKFANSYNRIKYHNEKLKEIREARSSVDNKLHKNYCILLALMKGKAQESFHKQFLIGKGYSFNVMTHYELYEKIKRHAVYDFLIIEDGYSICIIKY